ncbi:hypothetical protein GCM10022198_00230 [Klugiella xanthotipulae]|uniref:Uncharacterized protein n=1 Tax=Klugiella xanthotipulae TaxID=244735 RepID=A0A543I5E7_9MICO|nr:hypothetical protein [Klugiella xanthotipulae]TQM65836.1 hypothetical protein FB466_0650 [Klugiella xanthotipulae]
METLATIEDVVSAIGRDLTDDEAARAQFPLDKASELFRREARQHFTPGVSSPRLRVVGGLVTLPQRPAGVVTKVTDSHGRQVPFTQDAELVRVPERAGPLVRVTYSHGNEVVPDLVRLTVTEIARKVLGISKKALAGVTQYSDTTGPFTESETYATWAQGGQTMLSPDDAATARSYRVYRRYAIVQDSR